MENQEKKTSENPISRLGEWGKTGGPGRPPGMKNRWTVFREELIDLWHEEQGKEKMRTMFNSPEVFLKIVDQMISILPKEAIIDNSKHIHITNIIQNLHEKAQEYVNRSDSSNRSEDSLRVD